MKLPLSICKGSFSLLVTSLVVLPVQTAESAYGDLVWTTITGDVIFGAPGIGPHGEVVVGSADGNVYSFNADGSPRWIFEESTDWIESGPTISPDGTVYAGSWDNFLYAIDGQTGDLEWKLETEGLITGSPAIGLDGTVYAASHDGLLYAVNPHGTTRWVFESIDHLDAINSSPVLSADGTRIYFGNDSGELIAVKAADGSEAWVFTVTDIHPAGTDTETAISAPAAIGPDGAVYFSCENGYLYALDADGTYNWSYPTTDSLRSAPVLSSDGTLYFTAQDGYLYALDSEGFQLWESFLGDVFYCTPAIDADGNVVAAGYAGSAEIGAATRFATFNPDGEKIWEYIISGYNDSSPNIAPDGSIYIGAHDGLLYKFEGQAPLMQNGWPRFQASRRQTGLADDNQLLELIELFPSISQSIDGWAYVPWFSSGFLREAELPWIEHADHGFLYVGQSSTADVQYFDSTLGAWIFATAAAPNYLHRSDSRDWLYHLPGTTVETGRWFYDFILADWIP